MTQWTLEALRVNKGWTQQDVADRLGVSRFTVINWERKRPKELVIYALSALYEVDINAINASV